MFVLWIIVASSQSDSSTRVEELPPLGSERLLSANQILYCLSEDIRLEAARDMANTDPDIERFNSMINDYNARCGNYRYRPQELESVKREVQAKTTSLQAEGMARFQR